MRASFVQKLKSANKAASKAAKVASKVMEQAKSDLDQMKEKADSNLAAFKKKKRRQNHGSNKTAYALYEGAIASSSLFLY
jgi:hypothetical protein